MYLTECGFVVDTRAPIAVAAGSDFEVKRAVYSKKRKRKTLEWRLE